MCSIISLNSEFYNDEQSLAWCERPRVAVGLSAVGLLLHTHVATQSRHITTLTYARPVAMPHHDDQSTQS